MLHMKVGTVVKSERTNHGITELQVEVDGQTALAINYDILTGVPLVGDRVQLNTTAVDLALGTGGHHFVIANLSTAGLEAVGPGHIMKLRYTPIQLRVLAVEEEDSAFHQVMTSADSLKGTPVVAALLHSMVAPIAAGVKAIDRNLRVVYVMTDGGALPICYSRLVSRLVKEGVVDGTITAGHAFGGDVEAVNIYSAMLAAKHVLGADVIVVAMGPGIVGTGTPFGFSGVEQASILHAAHALEGKPVAVPRISFADARKRHMGLSHHTLTVLVRLTLVPVWVGLPKLPMERMFELLDQVRRNGLDRHFLTTADGGPAITLLHRKNIPLNTMGRSFAEDPAFFLAAGAAGSVAVSLI